MPIMSDCIEGLNDNCVKLHLRTEGQSCQTALWDRMSVVSACIEGLKADCVRLH